VLLPAIEDGDPNVKMGEILLAINEGKLADVETLHVQTAQLCLQKWQLLPALASGSIVHGSLLHSFHRLVELRESGQIMVETSNHSKRRTLPDLKNLLRYVRIRNTFCPFLSLTFVEYSAWRHRLPNDFESLLKWEDIFLWRTHMFNAITSNFQWSEAEALTALHDRPWTAIRMAKTARKHGLRDVSSLVLLCCLSLGTLLFNSPHLFTFITGFLDVTQYDNRLNDGCV
jgi:transformation/transcription domain-associated protein